MMNCWIIYNGSLVSEKFQDQAVLIAEAAKNYEVTPHIFTNDQILMKLYEPIHDKPNFVVFLDKDIQLATYLKNNGIPVFNDPDVLATCDHKGFQYLTLSRAGIPMPKTILAPKVYANFSLGNELYYDEVIDQLGLPLILKEARGSFGMKVYKIETKQQLIEKTATLSGVDHLFQQYIATSEGRDIRVNVIGQDVVAAMYRHSETDFRANITNGGQASKIELTEEQKQLALRAASAVDAEFAGVDLLFGENEQPIVCEVNAAAHIRNIFNVTGINVADAMIAYILNKLENAQ